jgi:PASTA domain/Glucodextranase, domain B
VRLTLAAPSDQATTLAPAASVRGTVAPAGATVLVAGRPAAVHGGSFEAAVPLAPGTNVIDVLAGAPHARGAVTALRVYRELPVLLPDVTGKDPSAAVAQLTRLGVHARVSDTGGFFESLIPASQSVCSMSPAGGTSVPPGASVQLQVAKLC